MFTIYNNSFFGFDDNPYVFLNFVHYWSIVSTPINILGLVVVLRGATQSMKSYKWFLFYYQLCSTLLEFNLCTMVKGNLYFPLLAGKCYGYYCTLLGDTAFWALFSTLILFLLLGLAIFQCFAFRHRVLLRPNSCFRLRSSTSIVFLVLLTLFMTSLMSVAIFVNDQRRGSCVQKMIQLYPHATYMIENIKNFYCLDAISVEWYILFDMVMLYLVFACIAVTGLGISCLIMIRNHVKNYSAYAGKLQRTYFITLIFQMGVPLIFIAVPLTYLLRVYAGRYIVPQYLNNIFFSFMHCHGLCSTLCLGLLKPYRVYVKSVIKWIARKQTDTMSHPDFSSFTRNASSTPNMNKIL